jgi:tetratricopeptide (TPR) repeat protein
VRWHAEDQARLARLIAARGRARLARGAATAQADLERARRLGAAVGEAELQQARVAGAIVALRHSDAEVRDPGRRILAAAAGAEPAWLGARPAATPVQRGQFGAWLWEHGARRAAWDALSAWHAGTQPPRDPALQDAYLVAARWWTPLDQPAPGGEPTGAMRCAFAGCAPVEVAGENLLERAYLIAPIAPPVTDPDAAAAIAVITLHQALRGEVSWGPAIAARVDLAQLAEPHQLAKLPRYVQPIFARLAGRDAAISILGLGLGPGLGPSDGATADQRLVIAAERVLAGAGAAEIEPLIGNAPYAEELRRVAVPPPAFTGPARAEAAARHAIRAVSGGDPSAALDALRAAAVGYARDPAIADRLVREIIIAAPDAASAHATAGALFDALGDPARARAAWQAAVDASAEPDFVRGLAEAQAHQGDGDAALITATAAAAASGDPAVVWTAVARGLVSAGRYVHALDAARSAIDLSTPDTLELALDTAIEASRALDRDAQVAALTEQRTKIAQSRSGTSASDPTDARGALEAYRQQPTSSTIARMWVASRWNPRAVDLRSALLAATTTEDPRHAVIVSELVELAGDRDSAVRCAAVAALR